MDAVDVRVRLLGRVVVEVDGAEVEPPPRTHGLLAILALEPDGVDRGHLATLVEPNADETKARRRLSRLLWLLRDAVADLPLRVTPRRVALDRSRCSVDAVEVEELAAAGGPTAAEAAFARLGGALCPTSDLPWVRSQRERFDARAHRLALRVAQERASRGDHDGAGDAADWVLAHDPGSTAALEVRVRADRAHGRRDAATAVVERWCEAHGVEADDLPSEVRELLGVLREDGTASATPLGEDASPQAWLEEARLAGARGDASARRRALSRLRQAVTLGEVSRAELRLVEVDAALDRDELELADRLLALGRDDPDTVALRVRRCRLARARGQLDRAAHEANEALLGAYGDQREEARLDALLALASVMSARAEGRCALAAAAQARSLAHATARLDAELEADVLAGQEEARQGRFAAAAERLADARARARSAGLSRIEGEALHGLARAHCRLGKLDRAEGLQREERELWHHLGLPVREAAACGEHAVTLARAGRPAEALDAAARAERLAESAGASGGLGWARSRRAFALLCVGDLEAAERAAEEASARGGEVGDEELVADAAVIRALTAHLRGDPATALGEISRASAWYEARDEPEHLPVVLVITALARLQVGEVAAAREAAVRALTEVAQIGAGDLAVWVHYTHARVLEASGDVDSAGDWLARGVAQMREIAASTGLPVADLWARDPLTRAHWAAAQEVGAGDPGGGVRVESSGRGGVAVMADA